MSFQKLVRTFLSRSPSHFSHCTFISPRAWPLPVTHSDIVTSILSDHGRTPVNRSTDSGDLGTIWQRMLSQVLLKMSLNFSCGLIKLALTLKRPGFKPHTKGQPGPERPMFFHIYMFVTIKLILLIMFNSTRTTRTPAFWGYPPPPHDYPYHWVILDPKSKEDKVKVTN